MADSSTKPDLAQLVADALSHIPVDKAKSIAEHPDTPGAVQKIRDALGIGKKQDVMSTQEQQVAKDAGIDTMAHPDNSSTGAQSNSSISEEDRIRNQAISDMAVAKEKAAREANNKPSTFVPQGMFEGLIDMGAKAMKQHYKELTTKESK